MPNPHRGEIAACLNGQQRVLVLTLGALAELESALDAPDLIALAERFERGQLSALEAIAIIGAGLRGGGGTETDDDIAAMRIEGGVPGAMRLVADLFGAAFAPTTDAPSA